MRFRVTVRKRDGQTDGRADRQTDGRGALQYLPSRAFGAAGDNKFFICENINIFGYLGDRGGGASIIRLGLSWFTFTLSLIMIRMSNIEAI